MTLTLIWAGAQNSQSPIEAEDGVGDEGSLAPMLCRVHDKSNERLADAR